MDIIDSGLSHASLSHPQWRVGARMAGCPDQIVDRRQILRCRVSARPINRKVCLALAAWACQKMRTIRECVCGKSTQIEPRRWSEGGRVVETLNASLCPPGAGDSPRNAKGE